MSIYTESAATAVEMLAEYGADATLKKSVTGEYDTETASNPVTITNYATKALVTNYDQADINGTLIQQGDQRMLMSPDVGATPATGDKVTFNGQDWSVIRANEVNPAGTVVIYKLQVRR